MCSPEHKYFLSVLLSPRARQGDRGFFPAAHALASSSRSTYWSHSAPWPKADEEGGKTKSNEREKGGFCAARVCGSQPEPPLGPRCPLWGSRSCFAAPQLLQVVVLWGVGWGDVGHDARSRLLWGQQVCSGTALFHGAIPGGLEGEGELVCTGQEPAAWPFPALSPCSSCCSRGAAGCQLLLSGFHWSRPAEIHWGRQEQRRDAAPLGFPQKPDPSTMGSPGQGPALSPPESGPPIFRRWVRKYQTHNSDHRLVNKRRCLNAAGIQCPNVLG